MDTAEVIEWDGEIYRRYPNSLRHKKYFRCLRKGTALHRDIWEAHHGPLKSRQRVEHIDGDVSNNDISNLRAAVLNEVVEFNGDKYYRYPGSRLKNRRCYFESVAGKLHRNVWVFHNGPVPNGWHIHHLDGDTGNNHIDNLEAIPPGEHSSKHAIERPYRTLVCEMCNGKYQTHSIRPTRWCSRACGNRHWDATQKVEVTRVCVICTQDFKSLKDSIARTCGSKCSRVLAAKTRLTADNHQA